MTEPYPLVPLGSDARRWATVDTTHAVLLVAHNITTLSRLLDIITVFDNDPRIQLVLTSTPSDPFRRELAEHIEKTGIVLIPWGQATRTHFDLAITASHHDHIRELRSQLVILSHGIGYTKYSARESREPRAESREPRAESREPRAVFGLAAEWVLRDGRPAARALVLSHTDQLDQLAAVAPAALPAAVVAGDPCYDRIIASLPFRDRYRSALGIEERTLVYVSSTWSRESTLGARFDLLRNLLAELPRDAYAVAMALHPNITHRHGPGQIRRWFADCLRAGLVILPEIDDWRTGLIAADVVIGDNGSVTGYGAAIGRPTLLCAFPEVPDSTPISELGRLADRLPVSGPFVGHIESALAKHRSARFASVADRVTSVPGCSHERLRELFYRILEISPPPTETPVAVLPAAAPRVLVPEFADVVTTRIDTKARVVRLMRRPAELQTASGRSQFPTGHLSCTTDYPLRSLRGRADVLIGRPGDVRGDTQQWLRHVLRDNPFCVVAAIVEDGTCHALTRGGEYVTLRIDNGPAEVLASVLYAWVEAGEQPATLAAGAFIEVGRSRFRITVLSV